MNPSTLEELKLPVEALLGRSELSLKTLSQLGEGSIVELDTLAGDPVELRISENLLARGEVVSVDNRLAVRITEIHED